MTIRITPNFTLRRVAGQLAVAISDGFEVGTMLTVDQARKAAEAFTVMAVMMGGDAADGLALEIVDPEFEGVGV